MKKDGKKETKHTNALFINVFESVITVTVEEPKIFSNQLDKDFLHTRLVIPVVPWMQKRK